MFRQRSTSQPDRGKNFRDITEEMQAEEETDSPVDGKFRSLILPSSILWIVLAGYLQMNLAKWQLVANIVINTGTSEVRSKTTCY